MKALKILKCSDSRFWYYDYVGMVVPIKRNGTVFYGEYTSVEPSGYSNIVRECDAEIIEVPNNFIDYYIKEC